MMKDIKEIVEIIDSIAEKTGRTFQEVVDCAKEIGLFKV